VKGFPEAKGGEGGSWQWQLAVAVAVALAVAVGNWEQRLAIGSSGWGGR